MVARVLILNGGLSGVGQSAFAQSLCKRVLTNLDPVGAESTV